MMIGNNDRQTIREKAPPAARPAAPKPNAQAAQPTPSATPPIPAPPPDPERQRPEPSEAAEHANMTPEQALAARAGLRRADSPPAHRRRRLLHQVRRQQA